jgi:hypothetical protein
MKRRSRDPSIAPETNASATKRPTGSSRRDFLKGFGTAAFAGAVPFATGFAHLGKVTPAAATPLNINTRPEEAYERRLNAALEDRKVPIPRHQSNGDEALYPSGIANYTKGFPHNDFGEVDPTVYASYRAAVRTGKRADFDNLQMGGNVALVDPQAGLCFDLESVDVSQHAIPAPFALATTGRAAEGVESYWMALARDVPFSQYGSDPTAQAAAAELNSLPAFDGPRDPSDNVTAATLFRGFTPGDLVGPYVSQLFLQPFSYGAIPFTGYQTDLPLSAGGFDYMTDAPSWLQVQNGQSPFASEHPDPQLRYPRSGRDLAAYVHNDVLFQEYVNAALMLMTMHAPLNSGNPYTSLKSESGFITFGFPQVQVLVAEVTARALKSAWFQKWFVHRLLRAEAFGGLVHFTVTGLRSYPLDTSVLNSAAVQAAFSRNGAYFLPTSYPEGSPQHPSYPSGHATVAGACVTVLKWFFSESFVIPDPIAASDDGRGLVPYMGADADQITVGGELNKLAANVGIGRNFSGIHWRADYQEGLLLGEAVAISLLRDQEHIFHEAFRGFTFTKFDGTVVTV